MGKNISNTKPATPSKRAAKTKPAAAKVAVAAPEIIVPQVAAPKRAARAAKPAVARAKKAAFSQEDVALRAYFISERRQAAGLPGDAHQDWIDAERELASEAGATGRRKAGKKS